MRCEGVIRTRHRRPACVAAALGPDDHLLCSTTVEDGMVVSRLAGREVGSIIATMDDYLMNCQIAEEQCSHDSA
ncbi:MAG TPA: KEOPS complex subunit Pcc1 [Methanoregulaceae archaeon]|nr:KEOPS complex subunit Pcc1 [Methanoregulaceae archaeon]